MVENNGSALGIICFGTGVLVGAALVYIITQQRNTPAPSVVVQQPTQTQTTPELPFIRQEITNILHDIQRAREENEYLKEQIRVRQQVPSTPLPIIVEKVAKVQSVQNEETWELTKDSKGRLQGVTVHRKVSPID